MKKIIEEWKEFVGDEKKLNEFTQDLMLGEPTADLPPSSIKMPRRKDDTIQKAVKGFGKEIDKLQKEIEAIDKHLYDLMMKEAPAAFGDKFFDYLQKRQFSKEELEKIYNAVLTNKKHPNIIPVFDKIINNIKFTLSKEKYKKYIRPLEKITNIVIHDTVAHERRTYRIFDKEQHVCLTRKKIKNKNKCMEYDYNKPYYKGSHFLITKGGTIKQLMPLNLITNHTKDPSGMNRRSVGIDIENYGKEVYRPPQKQKRSFDMNDPKNMSVYATPAQLKSLFKLVNILLGKLPNIERNVSLPNSMEEDSQKKNTLIPNPLGIGGPKASVGSGISAHGYIQSNKQDGTLPLYYLKYRIMGDSHEVAIKRTARAFNVTNEVPIRIEKPKKSDDV